MAHTPAVAALVPMAAAAAGGVTDEELAVNAVLVEISRCDDIFNGDAVIATHGQPALLADPSCNIHLGVVRVQEGGAQVISGTHSDARQPFEHDA